MIVEEEGFFHRISKMFVFFPALWWQELKSASPCHGSFTTCKCAAGYALMSSLTHLHSSLYPLPYILLQIRLFCSIMESLLCLTVNCMFGRSLVFKFSLFACPQFHSDVLCFSVVTSVYLLLCLIFHSSHYISRKLVLFEVLPLCCGPYLFCLLRISDHSLYKNQMLGHISSLAKAGSQNYDHTGV